MINIKDSRFKNMDYEDWLDHFRENDKHRLNIDFSNEPTLAAAQRGLIFPSISAFQHGEHSDGKCLSAAAKAFAKKHSEQYYPGVMELFIREENFHSSYLAQYMNFHGEPLKKDSRLDRLFRRLRQTGGIFTEVSVLVTAEIVALSYYSALGNVGEQIGSAALVRICKQMLHDELPHVVFQSYTLGHLYHGAAVRAFRVMLMELTTAAVWLTYGRLLRAGGYGYGRFRDENLGYLFQSFEIAENVNK